MIPVDLLSYALGIFGVLDWRNYTLATIIGIVPFAFIFAYLGTLPVSYQLFSIPVGVLLISIVYISGGKNFTGKINAYSVFYSRKPKALKKVSSSLPFISRYWLGFKSLKADIHYANSLKVFDNEAKGVAHPSYLVFLALGENDDEFIGSGLSCLARLSDEVAQIHTERQLV